MKNDPNVVWGDVNLAEAPIRTAADGTPLNPGQGGWPTLRYFNAETGVGGAKVEQKTGLKICDEFKEPARMVEATKESMKMCNAGTGAGSKDFSRMSFVPSGALSIHESTSERGTGTLEPPPPSHLQTRKGWKK